jgi:hypothetical protein
MTLVAFGMPFVALAFMSAMAYAIARYNRKPEHRLEAGQYHMKAAKVTWHWPR